MKVSYHGLTRFDIIMDKMKLHETAVNASIINCLNARIGGASSMSDIRIKFACDL